MLFPLFVMSDEMNSCQRMSHGHKRQLITHRVIMALLRPRVDKVIHTASFLLLVPIRIDVFHDPRIGVAVVDGVSGILQRNVWLEGGGERLDALMVLSHHLRLGYGS